MTSGTQSRTCQRLDLSLDHRKAVSGTRGKLASAGWQGCPARVTWANGDGAMHSKHSPEQTAGRAWLQLGGQRLTVQSWMGCQRLRSLQLAEAAKAREGSAWRWAAQWPGARLPPCLSHSDAGGATAPGWAQVYKASSFRLGMDKGSRPFSTHKRCPPLCDPTHSACPAEQLGCWALSWGSPS